jgi:hypothetical protein
MDKYTLVGGCADGKTVEIDGKMHVLRVCKPTMLEISKISIKNLSQIPPVQIEWQWKRR